MSFSDTHSRNSEVEYYTSPNRFVLLLLFMGEGREKGEGRRESLVGYLFWIGFYLFQNAMLTYFFFSFFAGMPMQEFPLEKKKEWKWVIVRQVVMGVGKGGKGLGKKEGHS